MKFIALKSKEVDVGLIPIALREYGICDVAEDEDDFINKIKTSFNSGDFYKGAFLYPGRYDITGFKTLKKIRDLEAGRGTKVNVFFLCDESGSISFLELMTGEHESFISSKIAKREILEMLINKKIINNINRGENVRKNFDS